MRRKSESSGILGRGSACLSCRRRKLKCTGTRPVCEQCSQMKRVHECKYDDSLKKSRTQLLREKLIVLEAKLRDLENGSSYSPQALSDSSVDSLDHCPEPSLSAEMHNTLIQTFIRHHWQCCLYINTSRFDSFSSTTVFQRTPPNPSLMSAIYLVGSFFSHTPLPYDLQTQLLEQALRNLTRSLHNQEHLMDVVQASCLIAQYFFFTHRVMEGNRHLLAAKRMAFDLGLYSLEPAYDSVLQDTMKIAKVASTVQEIWRTSDYWRVRRPCAKVRRNIP